MINSFRRNACLIAGTLLVGLSSVSADVVYDNSAPASDLETRFNPGTMEVGDQIILENVGFLTNFSFEYWADNTATPGTLSDPVEGRVVFYRMNGTPFNGYATPGTPFYDSGWFGINATPRATLNFLAGSDFPNDGLFIPVTELTWSVQFRNLGANDQAGVDLFSPPTVGQNYDDYWQREAGGWVLAENSVPMNFAARFEANIPEPSSISLLVLGGAAAMMLRRRQK